MSRMTMAVWQRRIRRLSKRMPDVVEGAYIRAAAAVVGHAQKRHLRGPKMPRGVSGGFSGSTLSAPTRRLRGSLSQKVKVTADRVVARVGTNVTNRGYSYPRAHEFGLGKMPERPFLRPSVEAKRENTAEEIRDAVMTAYARK